MERMGKNDERKNEDPLGRSLRAARFQMNA